MRKGHHSQRKSGAAGSILSIGSSGSILSIGSTGSILSVGSAGSILSIGSAGSLGSAFSVGSFASAGSVLSGLSCLSVLAWRSWRRVAVPRRGPGQPGTELRPEGAGKSIHAGQATRWYSWSMLVVEASYSASTWRRGWCRRAGRR
jgi:hypothetical protein